MFKEIVISSVKVFLALPGGIAALAALRKVAEETGFDKASPRAYEKLSIIINVLLYILIEHWIACVILAIFGGAIWALLVVEPKKVSFSEFQKDRQERIGD